MIALICCLLALSSSAYARAYGSYSSQPVVAPVNPGVVRDLPIQTGYGYQSNDLSTGMISNVQTDSRTLPTVSTIDSYGGSQLIQKPETFIPKSSRTFISPRQKLLQQQQELQEKIEETQIVTEADILCRGQQPEVVIPLDGGRRYVSCIADGKGSEQWCPTGLLYHVELQRCERQSGPSPDFCLSQPCLNGGRCSSELSTFKCTCLAGFDGKTCELDGRVCQTQRPCGTAPDTRCQSFRFEAALDYVCIFRNGQAFGFNAQQIHSNPCAGVDGPQSLPISDKGFIMCDGESMFIESCPGGTQWDNGNAACAWPDMRDHYSYGEQVSGYGYGGQRSIVPQSSYGSVVQKRVLEPKVPVEQTRVLSQYGQTVEQPRVLPQQQYGHSVEQPRVLPQQQYGHSVEQPRVLPQQQYGHSVEQTRVLPQQQYGHIIEQPKVVRPVEPKLAYGSQLPEVEPLPKVQSWQQPMQTQNLRTLPVQSSGY